MAHEVIEKHPNVEILHSVDFTDELPDDSSVSNGSTVTAIDSNGDPVASVIGAVSQSGMNLRAVLQGGVDGEDYLITFTGRGTTSTRDSVKLIELRVRSKLLGTL